MNNAVMFSSNSDEWATPQWLFDELNNEFNFDLDPCASDENHKTPIYYTKDNSGLSQKWGGVPSLLQSTLFTDQQMGRKGFRGRSQTEHFGRVIDTFTH